jgi:hypothetical protein
VEEELTQQVVSLQRQLAKQTQQVEIDSCNWAERALAYEAQKRAGEEGAEMQREDCEGRIGEKGVVSASVHTGYSVLDP